MSSISTLKKEEMCGNLQHTVQRALYMHMLLAQVRGPKIISRCSSAYLYGAVTQAVICDVNILRVLAKTIDIRANSIV